MKILIIGDKINPNNKDKSVWESKSLKFLKEFILDELKPLYDFDFINSVDIKNERDFLVAWVKCYKAICLGNDALKRLMKINPYRCKKIKKIPHPSFWLRFKAKQLLEYKRIFKEAIK